jgi:Polyketide cyclase / dehydrase and lipid transport
VTIARPVEDDYRFVLELDKNAPDPDVESVVKEPEGPTGPGTTFRFRYKSRGKVKETTTRFTSVEPNRRIEFAEDIGVVRPEGAFILEPADGGTRLSVRIKRFNAVGPLRLLSPLLARMGQRVSDERLERIETANESAAR